MADSGHFILAGGRVVTPEGVADGAVEVKDGWIVRAGNFSANRVRGVQVIELDGAWLLPGLVDLHTNDGVALLKKPDDPQWHVERLRQV
ncbi:MAG: hypothetical protein V1794_10325, partial [Candidatus Glassbacteria bacterium]